MITALLTAAALSIDPSAAASIGTNTTQSNSAVSTSECTETCLSSLEDDSAALQCYLQCLALDLGNQLNQPVDAPEWVPTSDDAPSQPVNHSFCLDSCEETSDTVNALETCRLNCAVSWSVLTTEPANCAGGDASEFDELCDDPDASACKRGCFVNSVTCSESCESADDKRPTDVASCKLRCRNLSEMCRDACETEQPDNFTSIDGEPGC